MRSLSLVQLQRNRESKNDALRVLAGFDRKTGYPVGVMVNVIEIGANSVAHQAESCNRTS
jgi:hypothetical protein